MTSILEWWHLTLNHCFIWEATLDKLLSPVHARFCFRDLAINTGKPETIMISSRQRLCSLFLILVLTLIALLLRYQNWSKHLEWILTKASHSNYAWQTWCKYYFYHIRAKTSAPIIDTSHSIINCYRVCSSLDYTNSVFTDYLVLKLRYVISLLWLFPLVCCYFSNCLI